MVRDGLRRPFGARSRRVRGLGPGAEAIALYPPRPEIPRMPPSNLPTRRYGDAETEAILRRAAELQASGPGLPRPDHGLTLAELEGIAREAGLDPALVRLAAREIDRPQAARPAPLLGAPTRLLAERVSEGEVAEEQWEQMVGEIQRTLGAVGHVSRVGRTRSWTSMGLMGAPGPRLATVTVVSQEGHTTLRAEEPIGQLAGGIFGGIVGGLGGGGLGAALGIGMGVFHSAPVALGLGLALLAGSYGLARLFFTRTARSRQRSLDDLVDRLASQIAVPPAS